MLINIYYVYKHNMSIETLRKRINDCMPLPVSNDDMQKLMNILAGADTTSKDFNIVYSFIGTLPSYIVDTLYQMRLFYDGDIYLVIDDLESKYLKTIQLYNIKIIPYNDVKDDDFLIITAKYSHKFIIEHRLDDRKLLYLRTFERFYLLHNLMNNKSLINCLFIELDNLMYDDPRKWLAQLNTKDIAMMYDNNIPNGRLSTGIMYSKNTISLKKLLLFYDNFIQTYTGFINEMTANWNFYMINPTLIQLLPTYWNASKNALASNEFSHYDNTIFDAAAIGVFLCGNDLVHTNGKLLTGQHNRWSDINLRKPYIKVNSDYILINNLHIHSKKLYLGLSKELLV
jgi:hypothetical protein